jgi:hypothetical protein
MCTHARLTKSLCAEHTALTNHVSKIVLTSAQTKHRDLGEIVKLLRRLA